MTILLTCAGRRSFLVACFKSALVGLGQVIACDACGSAAALAEADRKFIVPAVTHPGYADRLLAICREHQVRLLLSVNDLELALLAARADRFRDAGTTPVIATPQVIQTCLDKWQTFNWLRDHDIPTPATYLRLEDARQALSLGTIKFPLIIKPRWGSSSIGIARVENEHELAIGHEWSRIQIQRTILRDMSWTDPENGIVIQEYLAGQEYGLDVLNDLQGSHACALARRKLVMRAGETDRAITVEEPNLVGLGKRLGEQLKHVGNLDCDVIRTERGWYVLDLNPRFGGGYPFSHVAGANFPAALIAWANHEQPETSWLRQRSGVLSSKTDRLVVVEPTQEMSDEGR